MGLNSAAVPRELALTDLKHRINQAGRASQRPGSLLEVLSSGIKNWPLIFLHFTACSGIPLIGPHSMSPWNISVMRDFIRNKTRRSLIFDLNRERKMSKSPKRCRRALQESNGRPFVKKCFWLRAHLRFLRHSRKAATGCGGSHTL